MKQKILTFVILLFVTISYGQFSDEEKKLLFPQEYTFEQAEIFEKEGKIDKAIWFYINLYPENSNKVIEKVKQLNEKNDTIDLPSLIINSFSLYSVFDPTISNWDNGYPIINKQMLDLKGSWGDALISEIKKKIYSEMEVIPIKTKDGYFIIFNYKNSKFSLSFEGKDLKISEPYITFLIENKALQITVVNVSDVPNLDNCKNRIDSLYAHKNYEIVYLSKVVKEKLIVVNENILNISGHQFLLWEYSLPPKLKAKLVNQYIMTTIIGDKILLFHTAGESSEKIKKVKKYLIKYASSIKVYDENLDINTLIINTKN